MIMYPYLCSVCGEDLGIDEDIPDEELKDWKCIFRCNGVMVKDIRKKKPQ